MITTRTQENLPVEPADAVATGGDGAQRPARVPRVRAGALREELAALADVVDGLALVDVLLERGFEMGATDIHLDPQETNLRTRIRVDGMLHDVLQVPHQLGAHMISRVKLMANMNIAEKRVPQDGHFTHRHNLQPRDVRVASSPNVYGERLVLRLFPNRGFFTDLENLGMEPAQAELFRQFLAAPSGVVLSVGPVGSGKTTTMYTAIQLLNEPTRSIATIEDPIELRVPGVNQMQVDAHVGLNFVKGLRVLLRQDPDVIMVGEIRDGETAHTVVQAGLSGSLVLSTMHSNDAAGSLDMFLELGVPTVLLADALVGIVSQRLVRKACPECRESEVPNQAARKFLGVNHAARPTIFRGRGCDACFNTGYLGLTGVFEIMQIERTLRQAILDGATGMEIRESAARSGMLTLTGAASRRVCEGITTLDEMHRVLAAFGPLADSAPAARRPAAKRAKRAKRKPRVAS